MEAAAALIGFLGLLDRDLVNHPERLRPVPSALFERARELVRDIEIDLDAPL